MTSKWAMSKVASISLSTRFLLDYYSVEEYEENRAVMAPKF